MAATASPSTSYVSRTLDVIIAQQTVTPLETEIALSRGETVSMTVSTDHDVTISLSGAGQDQEVFVARLTQIPVSFVAEEAGTVVVTCSDPEATIARFVVS